MAIKGYPFKDYANYKLRRYYEGDKGALGDLWEACVDTIEYPNFDYNNVLVAQLNAADRYGKGGSKEIGHNGKQWNLRKPYARRKYPRKVIYGVVTLDEFITMVDLINRDEIAAMQAMVLERTAIFPSEDDYMETMDSLTRGKGIKIAHTEERGDLVMTIYNPSKHKAFLKALEDGRLTRYTGRG